MRHVSLTLDLKPGEQFVRCQHCEEKAPGSWAFICYKEKEVKKTTHGRGGYDGEHNRYQYAWDVWYVVCPKCQNEMVLRESEERSTLYGVPPQKRRRKNR